jgi:predicted phage terminase large subunit-like protein
MNDDDRLFQSIRLHRRWLGERSLLAFAEIYLKNNCSAPYSKMHLAMFQKLQDITKARKAKVAIAAPRGHAKSTIVSLVYVLWCVLYLKERMILIVSNTSEQAAALLKHIKDELRTNFLITSDFPEICRGKRPKPWRGNKIQLPNGAMICAYGAGQGLRGIKNRNQRPGLIIADDLEGVDKVDSEEQREKLRSWFSGTLINTGYSETNVIVIGTILHHDSLLANLVDSEKTPGWDGTTYRAIEQFSMYPKKWEKWSAIFRSREEFLGKTGPEGALNYFKTKKHVLLRRAKVLWPEWDSYYELMVLRQTEGDIYFQREKQNCPLDPRQCIFKKENIHFWDDEYKDTQHLIDAIGKYGRFYGACDPSMGRSNKGDYTAIIILLKDRRNKIMYTIAADIIYCTPTTTIEKIIQYTDTYRFSEFAVESNNFQELLVEDLKRRLRENGRKVFIKSLNHSSQKIARISSLETYVSQGLLQFNSKHQELLQQLTQFPMAKNDDGPDALQMALYTARKRTYVGAWPPPEKYRNF